MSILLLLIPVIACIILFIFYRRNVNIVEYLCILGSCALVYFIYTAIEGSVSKSDTEYIGDYVTKVRHEDRWDEWIHKTCSRTVSSGTGKNKRTRTIHYDCSYRKEHPEEYYMYPKLWSRISIDKSEYDALRYAWKTPQRFVDMNRRYYKIDGDAQEYDWSGNPLHARTLSKTNSYDNPILGSNTTIYKRDKISEGDIIEYGLVDYPLISNEDQKVILGRHWVPNWVDKKWRFINAYYGKDKQVRVFVIFYKDKTSESATKQISYWEGGNKNELIIMMGIDNSTKLEWVKIHSWSDDPTLEVKLDTYISSGLGKSVDMNKLSDFLTENISYWKRKEFSDFKYIQHEMSSGNDIALGIIILIITIIGCFIVVNNELDLIGWRRK